MDLLGLRLSTSPEEMRLKYDDGRPNQMSYFSSPGWTCASGVQVKLGLEGSEEHGPKVEFAFRK